MERLPQSPSQPRPLCEFGPNDTCLTCGRAKPGRPGGRAFVHCGPRNPRVNEPPPKPPVPKRGPGQELKKLLSRIGITAQPNCKCNARAREMDARGCDWCEQNIQTISGWLEEEANRRGLPYSHIAGKALIHLSIRRARKQMSGTGSDQT